MLFIKNMFDTFFLSLVGLNVISLVGIPGQITTMWTSIEPLGRLSMSMVGFIYLSFRAHHFYHDSKLNREEKRIKIDQLRKSLNKDNNEEN